jgi:WD40 repeat protein
VRHDAFISYKHARSSAFAERLELALKAYAKPLWKPPPSIFRDEKYLRPGLDLPKMISDALDESEFLVYLASPEAAASPWVQDELRHWCSNEARRTKLIIVLTEGTIAVLEPSKTIDWAKTDAVPAMLREVLLGVPLYLDCTQLTVPERQTLLDPDFKKVVNAIVAAFRDVDPIVMSGQEVLQHRKNLRNRNLLLASVVATMLLAAAGATVAFRKSQETAAQSRIAKASQLASEAEAAATAQYPQRALLLAAAAAEVTRGEREAITPQAEQTLRNLLTTIGGFGLAGHTGEVDRVAFIDEQTLLSSATDGQAMLWSLDADGRARERTELTAKHGAVLAMQVRRSDATVRIVSARGHVVTRRLAAGHAVTSAFDLRGFLSEEVACGVKVVAGRVLQMDDDGVLRIWDLDRAGSTPVARKIGRNFLDACTFSPDGNWLYAESAEGPPIVMHTASGVVAAINGARTGVHKVAFDPASRRLALAMTDGRIRFYRLDPAHGVGPEGAEVRGKKDGNVAIAYSSSGKLFAAGAADGTIRLWRTPVNETAPQATIHVPFELYAGMDSELSFTRHDTLLVVSDGLRAGAAIPLSANGSFGAVQVLFNHPSPDEVMGDRATPFAVHPTSPLLVAAGNDHTASVWSMASSPWQRRAEPLRGHDNDILVLAFSPGGRWLASAGRDRVIRIWPGDRLQWMAAPAFVSAKAGDVTLAPGLPNPGGGVQLAQFFDDSWFEGHFDVQVNGQRIGQLNGWARLAAGRIEGLSPEHATKLRLRSMAPALQKIVLRDLHARESLPPPADDVIYDADRDGRAVAEATADGIRVWDMSRGHPRSILYRGIGLATQLRINSRLNALGATDAQGHLARWTLGQPNAPAVVRDVPQIAKYAQSPFPTPLSISFLAAPRWMDLSMDGLSLLDMSRRDGRTWRLSQGAHESAVLGDCCIIQLFPDRFEFWITTADGDAPIRLASPPMADVTAYAYDAVRRHLLLGFFDGRVLMLEHDAGGHVQRQANITSHDYPINSLALSASGRIVATGSYGGITMTTIDDDLSVVRHVRLKGNRGGVGILRFSPNDRWLLAGGEDNSILIHPVSAQSLLDLACATAGRTLSDIEKGRLGDMRLADVCKEVVPR